MTGGLTACRPSMRGRLTVGAVALLCAGLAACSSSNPKTATPAVASDQPGTSASSVADSVPAPGSGMDSSATATADPTADPTSPPVTEDAAGAAADPTSLPDPAAAGKIKCALLTRAEAEAAVGQPLTTGSEIAALGSCGYTSPDFAAGVGYTVSSWESINNAAHSSGHTPPAVSGIGDEAYFGVGLSVRKGSKGFLILMNGPKVDDLPDAGLAKQKAVAALMLPRL